MFLLIKLLFIVLLKFIKSLATKCVPLNNKPCIAIPIVDLSPVEFNYYPFMISLDICSETCHAFDD